MTLKHEILSFTTTSGGDATTNGTRNILGKLYAVQYLPAATSNATITLTCQGVAARTLLVKATAGATNVMYYPRDLVNGTEDGAALTGTSGGDRAQPLINGTLRVVISSGGATLSGAVIVYWEE